MSKIRKAILYPLALRKICRVGLWFIDIPRTSSSSVRVELGKRFGFPYGKRLASGPAQDSFFGDHRTAYEMKLILGPKRWGTIHSFTLVRDPIDRMASIYNYQRQYHSGPDDAMPTDINEYIDWRRDRFPEPPFFPGPAFYLNQLNYLLDPHGVSLVSEVIKFEERADALSKLARKFDIEHLGATQAMKSDPQSSTSQARSAISPENLAFLQHCFAREMNYLGYPRLPI